MHARTNLHNHVCQQSQQTLTHVEQASTNVEQFNKVEIELTRKLFVERIEEKYSK